LLLFLVPIALALAWLGPAICAIQHLVPPDMRAVASALFLFINNLIGLGLSAVDWPPIGSLQHALRQRIAALPFSRALGSI
jgi:hypothetical protein